VDDIPTAIIEYMLAQVVLEGAVLAVLTMPTDELLAFSVVHDVFIVAAPALGALGFEPADDRTGG